MKILEANAGVLTNFDVLNFLKSKGASEGLSRVLAKVSPSEYKVVVVYDYLVETPACTQTRENIKEFKEKCRKYDLAEAEVLNIINTRPSNIVAVYPIIEDCDVRLGDDVQDLVDLVVEVFPALPSGTEESDSKTTNIEGTEDPKEGDQNDKNTEKPESEDIMDSSDGS